MPLKREILYPVFQQVLLLTDDIFWREIFEELSYGISPPGTYISKGVLCCNQDSKEWVYRLNNKDPKKIFDDITKLLKKNNFMSKNDRKAILEELNDAQIKLKSLSDTDWVSIKKKTIKDMMFQNYLIKMKNTYNLREGQVKRIYNFINLGIMLKSIKPADINYKNGEILSIKGISFKEGGYTLDFDIYEGLVENVEEETVVKKTKYLKDL